MNFYRDCFAKWSRPTVGRSRISTAVTAFINGSQLLLRIIYSFHVLLILQVQSFHFIKQNSRRSKALLLYWKPRRSYGVVINYSTGEMAAESINGLLLQQTEANIIIDSYRIREAIIV